MDAYLYVLQKCLYAWIITKRETELWSLHPNTCSSKPSDYISSSTKTYRFPKVLVKTRRSFKENVTFKLHKSNSLHSESQLNITEGRPTSKHMKDRGYISKFPFCNLPTMPR